MTKVTWQAIFCLVLVFSLAACGENPRSVIRQASSMVCRGEANPEAAIYSGSDVHPLVILRENGDRHQWDGELSEAWFPATATDTQLVACVGEPAKVAVEVCEYDGPDITRYRYKVRIQLFEARSAKLVDEQDFLGSMPRDCGKTEDYDLKEITGNDVYYSDIEGWLRNYVESEAQANLPANTQPTSTPKPTTQPAVKEISAFCGVLNDSPQTVESGQQVLFYWHWGAASEDYLQDYIDAASFSLYVDDERVTAATIRSEDLCEEGGYCATWKLSEPMTFSPGSHYVNLWVWLEREITDGYDLDNNGELDTYGPNEWIPDPVCEVIAK